MRYENFKYVPNTGRQLATVDEVWSFLWFSGRRTLRVMKDSDGRWHSVETGRYTEGYQIEYLEREHNAMALS